MDRINGANTVDIGSGHRGFRAQNKAAGVAGTELTAAWFNAMQEEIMAVIAAGGLDPDAASWTQLRDAIAVMVATAATGVDLSGYLQKSGGTMTGALALAANAAAAMQAVPLQQLQAYTPAKLSTASGSAPSFSARAWVLFDATPTILGAGNVAGVTNLGTGITAVSFTTALPDANYAVVGAGWAVPNEEFDAIPQVRIRSSTGFTVTWNDPTGNALRDPERGDLIVVR